MTLADAFDLTRPDVRSASDDAADVLRGAASAAPEKLANMLRVCADALRLHPTPLKLCRVNASRLNASLRGRDVSLPPGMGAIDVTLAAEAFDRAADILAERRAA